jgi:hypothetical protein
MLIDRLQVWSVYFVLSGNKEKSGAFRECPLRRGLTSIISYNMIISYFILTFPTRIKCERE